MKQCKECKRDLRYDYAALVNDNPWEWLCLEDARTLVLSLDDEKDKEQIEAIGNAVKRMHKNQPLFCIRCNKQEEDVLPFTVTKHTIKWVQQLNKEAKIDHSRHYPLCMQCKEEYK